MDNLQEIFPIVDEEGKVIGSATRGECHSGSKLLHPVVHLHVFNSKGNIYLQRRPEWKDIQPGKWDTAVGGHIDYGETPEEALHREVREELDITDFQAEFVDKYVFESKRERELVYVSRTIYDGEIRPSAEELDGGRFWTIQEIYEVMGKDILTPNFEYEYKRCFKQYNKKEDMVRIVILDGYTANPGDLSWKELESLGQLTVYERTKPEETVARAAEADIVLTNKVIIGKAEIEQLPHLKYIGVLATGYNVVDIKAAHERGIIVTNVPAYSTESVAQMVFAHLLTVTNRTEHYAIQNRAGRWTNNPDFSYSDTLLTEIAGKTIGIVGLGNIGKRVAQIALAFGLKVKAFTSKAAETLPDGIQKADMQELFLTADVISLHCPLTDNTKHLINAETIGLMKKTAIVINTGRGPLVDDQAVADALEDKRIAAYCADVLTEEPPRADNPLLKQQNAYITPHIAWATVEARVRLLQVAIENVRAFLNGTPQNVV